MRSKILGVVSTAALIGGSTLIAPLPASAGSGNCAGNLITTLTHTSSKSGQVVAKTGVYDDGSQICAVSIKQGAFYGSSTYMELYLHKSGTTSSVDRENFLYQAGPIRKGRDGCVNVELTMKNNSGQVVVDQDYRGICG